MNSFRFFAFEGVEEDRAAVRFQHGTMRQNSVLSAQNGIHPRVDQNCLSYMAPDAAPVRRKCGLRQPCRLQRACPPALGPVERYPRPRSRIPPRQHSGATAGPARRKRPPLPGRPPALRCFRRYEGRWSAVAPFGLPGAISLAGIPVSLRRESRTKGSPRCVPGDFSDLDPLLYRIRYRPLCRSL